MEDLSIEDVGRGRELIDAAPAGSSSTLPREMALKWLPLALFCVASLLLYRDAFDAPFYSDDIHNIVSNPYIQSLSSANSLELLRPSGVPAKLTQNYAPLHMFAHAAEWAVLAERVAGYRVVNALLHALASFLLLTLLLRSGLQRPAAWLGGVCFLVHPANVESVAWIYQLKTSLSLCLALLALLFFDRRPVVACGFFVGALLTKALAAFALPVALTLWWVRRSPRALAPTDPAGLQPALGNRSAAWLGVWGGAVAIFAWAAFGVFSSTNANVPPLDSDPAVVARSIVAIGGRYLWMSLSTQGISAFQEVELARSWTDLRWLASALVLGLLAWRGVVSLRMRREEGAYWLWAAVSFAPISQIFPFLHPMADRYLYFILPGLIGGVLLASQHTFALTRTLRWGVIALCVAGLAFFTLRSVERVHLWRYPSVLLENDAIANHPNGLLANNRRARVAAAAGDVEGAVAALWMTLERGDLRYRPLLGDPAFAPIRNDPRFTAIIAETAQRWLALRTHYRNPSQVELYRFSEAAALLMQYELAESLLVQALEVGGLSDDVVRAQLGRVRAARRSEEAAPSGSAPE